MSATIAPPCFLNERSIRDDQVSRQVTYTNSTDGFIAPFVAALDEEWDGFAMFINEEALSTARCRLGRLSDLSFLRLECSPDRIRLDLRMTDASLFRAVYGHLVLTFACSTVHICSARMCESLTFQRSRCRT